MKIRNNAALCLSMLALSALGGLSGCSAPDSSATDGPDEIASVDQGLTTVHLASTDCGTWDAAGKHTKGSYFVGHSTERPADTLSYFVFDLTPIKGKTVTAANLTIPGSTDWSFTVPWTDHTPLFQFKLGPTPLPAGLTLAHVTGGSNDATVYGSVHHEQDLGYGWTPVGSGNLVFDAFHYNPVRFQTAVNGGGLYPMFAVSRFGEKATTEEYIFGGITACSKSVTLNVTTQ